MHVSDLAVLLLALIFLWALITAPMERLHVTDLIAAALLVCLIVAWAALA